MKIQSIINGGVTMVLEPESTLEEEVLKALTKQSNGVFEVRMPIAVLGRTIKGSVLIGSKDAFTEPVEVKSETQKL